MNKCLNVDKSKIRTKIGIWQGRFQIIHRGHEYMFHNELVEYEKKHIAIVNPNPSICPYDSSIFYNFRIEMNPLNYFSRMLLWKKLVENYNLDNPTNKIVVNFFPCWHAQEYIVLENEFLPQETERQKDREWIIPNSSDYEQNKSIKLTELGEKVNLSDSFRLENLIPIAEGTVLSQVHSSDVRNELSKFTLDNIKKEELNYTNLYVPEKIIDLTINMYYGNDPLKYLAFSFIGDYVDVYSLQYCINKIKNSDEFDYLLFVIPILVSHGATSWPQGFVKSKVKDDELPWWYKKSIHPTKFINTYYEKLKLVNDIMEKYGIENYLITPYFIMDEDATQLHQYSTEMLPSLNNITFVFNEDFIDDTYYNKYGYYFRFKHFEKNIIIHSEDMFPIDECIINNTQINNGFSYLKIDRREQIEKLDTIKKNIDSACVAKTNYIKNRSENGFQERIENVRKLKMCFFDRINIIKKTCFLYSIPEIDKILDDILEDFNKEGNII